MLRAFACQREENCVSVHRNAVCVIKLGQSWSIHNTEMAGAENLELVPKVATFHDVSGKDTAFYLLSASRTQEQSYHGDDPGRKPRSRS